ncbi:MAG: DNA polymerase III subunit delta' C-terminal domain-containing protein, partial [Candidatus Izemoplasmatales bacterium]|nr:DNA polymerase III subunit delta' C-terminal domain-containing protein [Candidatus Izemoplasmatales bacterium]
DFANTLYIKALAKKESLLLLSKSKKELILSSNETFDFFITMLLVLQKDVYHMKKHLPSLVVDTIDIELITQLAKRSSQSMIEELLQQMLELKSRLRYHINQSLAFDNLIMHLERGLQYGI